MNVERSHNNNNNNNNNNKWTFLQRCILPMHGQPRSALQWHQHLHFGLIGLNVDFTGVVSTVGGVGVLRGEKTTQKQKQNKNDSGCGGG